MASKIMDKTRQDHQQQLQAAAAAAQLKCPRCDSSNTKFCYYNNYSLSQPRHFCKACKRYWTRGGTLRNVPVGGGCRKNKRLKTSSSSSTPSSNTNPHPQNSSINVLSSSVSNHMSPPIMFYGASADSNLQFSRLVPPPQLDNIGLGFSSHIADLRDGFDSIKQIQDMVTSNNNNNNHFGHPAISFERNMQVLGNSEEVKIDHQSQNRSSSCQNQMEQNQMDLSFNDASHFWNPMNSTSNWLDQMNTGSSLTNSLF